MSAAPRALLSDILLILAQAHIWLPAGGSEPGWTESRPELQEDHLRAAHVLPRRTFSPLVLALTFPAEVSQAPNGGACGGSR